MKQPDSSDNGNRKDLAAHRLQVGREDLQAAKVLLEVRQPKIIYM